MVVSHDPYTCEPTIAATEGQRDVARKIKPSEPTAQARAKALACARATLAKLAESLDAIGMTESALAIVAAEERVSGDLTLAQPLALAEREASDRAKAERAAKRARTKEEELSRLLAMLSAINEKIAALKAA